MTLSTQTNKVQYTCNSGTDTFPYTFEIIQSADLYVIYTDLAGTDHQWTENTEYIVTNVGEEYGGNVVVDALYVPASGTVLTIYREVPLTQESDYVENDPFHADTLETDLDRIIMITQQLDEQFSRVLQLNITDGSNPDMTIPNLEDRSETILGFDENGDLTVYDNVNQLIGTGTDNSIVRYDGDSQYVQDSLVYIDDSGNISGLNDLTMDGDLQVAGDANFAGDVYITNGLTVDGALTVTSGIFTTMTVTSGIFTTITCDELINYGEANYFYQLDVSNLNAYLVTYGDGVTWAPGSVVKGLVCSGVAGEAMDFGTLCYKADDGKYYISDNTDPSTLPAVAMAGEQMWDVDYVGTFLLNGYAHSDYWTWDMGAVIYTGASALPTYIKPTSTGDNIQVVGWAIDLDVVFFNPNYTVVEVA